MKRTFLILIFPLALCTSLGVSCASSSAQDEPTFSSDPDVIARGKQLFELNCVACHNFRATGIGPNLSGVTREVSAEWLKAFITNPPQVIQSGDERAAGLFAAYKTYMPPFAHFSETDLDALLAYLHTQEARPETPTRTDWGELVLNPILEQIPPSGITLVIKEYAQLPATAEKGQQARVNKIAPLPGSERLFAHDLRGKLYELVNGEPRLFLDLAAEMPYFMEAPGHGTGMGSFAFHPEYAQNGLFYTSHTDDPNTSPPADFGYADSLKNRVRWVVTEWKQDEPGSLPFTGSQRELFRIDMVTHIHGMQDISFNPLAQAGDEDYGLLYIGIGDGGSVEQGNIFLLQDKRKLWGSILRIDPQGTNGINGNYGFPSSNPFVGEAGARGEIYAMGFRNPHRFAWDPATGNLLASGIGQHYLEELNLIKPGLNYGWPDREGTFRLDKYGDIGKLYPLPENDAELGYTYAVAQFDHDEGAAICGGYVYQGERMPALQGKYIFGEILGGRMFMLDAAALELGKQAPIQSVALEFEDGTPAEWPELTDNVRTGHTRVDFRMGYDAQGELYVSTKANGKIFQVVGMKGGEGL